MASTGPLLTDHRVLLFLPTGDDATTVRSLLGRAKFPCHGCGDVDELCRELDRGAGTAVVAVELLTPRTMNRLVEQLGRQESWSDFPVIILFEGPGSSTDSGLRMFDLLEPLGNVTVLERPISSIELVSAVQAALRSRRRQYQVRHLLRLWDRGIRHRDRFLTLLAHELRTPLSTIRHGVCILERIGSSEPAAAEQRALIERQASRLATLVDEMQNVYQVLAGKVRLQREPVDLGELAAECIANAEVDSPGQRHRLVLSKPNEPVYVDGDPQRLRQVIGHLLANALRYTPPGGRVDLVLGRESGDAVIRVKDTGVGLAPEALSDLFGQFSEDDDALDRPPEGGLRMGLTMVQNLVKLHGGTVTATSAGRDRGSEFVVRLPVSAAPVELAHATPAGVPAKPGPRHILVIEDNPDGRESLRMMLELWGHRVEAAADGRQGVDRATANPPEVVILDIGLPGLDGYQVARQLRSSLKGVKLIAMTGYGQPHDRQRAQEAGFDQYLIKPVVPTDLRELIDRLPRERGRSAAGAS